MKRKEQDGGPTTLEKIAKIAKVSVSTVSRALNDHPSISASTKKQLWALARKHGYEFRRHMPASPIGAEGAITVVPSRASVVTAAAVSDLVRRMKGSSSRGRRPEVPAPLSRRPRRNARTPHTVRTRRPRVVISD